jgi:hypothetical protein
MAVFLGVELRNLADIDRRIRGVHCSNHRGDEFSILLMETESSSETSVNSIINIKNGAGVAQSV